MRFFPTGLILFSLLLTSPILGQVTSADSLALVDLYNSTNGSGWTDKTNWLSANPVSTWNGVTVTGNRVSGINLSANNLVGTIPSSIGNLSSLTQLQLFDNQLSGSIPMQIGSLLNLVTLGLENNQFSGVIPETMGNLTIATSITLGNNLLTDSVPVTFTNLTSLEQLEVQNNRLEVFPDLSGIGTLTGLKLEGNRFTFEDIEPNLGVTSFTYSPQDSIDSYSSVSYSEGTMQTLTTTVGGANNQYQWKKDGSNIAGATGSTYTINAVQVSDAGVYSCAVSNSAATALTLHRRTTTVTVTGSAPGTPPGLSATAVSTSQIDLSWSASSGVPVRYQIFRSLSGTSGFSQIDSVDVPTTTYSSTGLNSKTVYFYRVKAVGNFGVSGVSNTANDTTLNNVPILNVAILDTNLVQDYPKTFHRVLSHIFTDPDDPTLSFSVQTNPAQFTSTISNDSLYTAGGTGFTGTGNVIVSATDGQASVSDTFAITVAVDGLSPTISGLSVPSSTAQSSAAAVSATVTDNGGIASVFLFYRTGAGNYDSTTMAGSGDLYTGQTPSSAAGLGGISVFVRARDNAGNTTYSDTVSIGVTFSQLTSTIVGSEYATGVTSQRWRLISVPADLDNKNIGSLFPNVSSSQFAAYNGDPTPSQVSTLLPGQAVWFYQNSGVDVPIGATTGTTNPISGFQVTLVPGWNLVGAPFTFAIAASTTAEYSGPWLYSGTGTEVGGWSRVTSMKPFGGYAFYNKTAGNLTLTMTPGGISTGKLAQQAVADEKIRIKLMATAQKNGLTYPDRWNYLSVTGDSDTDLEEPEPVAPGDRVSVYFLKNGLKRSHAMLADSPDGVTIDFAIFSTMKDLDVQLDLSFELAREGWTMRIYDVGRNVFYTNGEIPRIHFDRDGEQQFRLQVGTEAYLSKTSEDAGHLPAQFTVGQNFPNPFNPSTQIPFALPQQSRVTLTVYNVLGQRIRSLIEGEVRPVGSHTAVWDGKDDQGRGVASGIYIYSVRLETIGGIRLTQNRKMILVK